MLGRLTATGMVIASMVGTGVFISLGFQVETISSTSALLLLWFVGGVYALCGAFCYAELASRMPRSGGEYNFLSQIYHPSIGFLAGWISVIVGFAAPTAVAALVVGKFTSATPHNQTAIAIAVILLCGGIHFFTAKIGHSFQNIFTAVKIILLGGFSILCFLMITNPQPVSIIPSAGDFEVIFSEHFAEAFVWVTFSYSGWNAAVYVTGEIREASRVIPFALLLGTTIVTFLYLLLNYTFLQSIPFVELKDLHFMDTLKPGIPPPEPYQIAELAADQTFSGAGRDLAKIMVSIGLVSTIGAFVFIGPRITQSIGEDFKPLRLLARRNQHGIPIPAIVVQLGLSIALVLSGDVKSIVLYVEFSLIIFAFLTVLGLFILRFREKVHFKGYLAWGFPWTGLFFLIMSGWVLVAVFKSNPTPAMAGIGTILVGLFVYCFVNPKRKVWL